MINSFSSTEKMVMILGAAFLLSGAPSSASSASGSGSSSGSGRQQEQKQAALYLESAVGDPRTAAAPQLVLEL